LGAIVNRACLEKRMRADILLSRRYYIVYYYGFVITKKSSRGYSTAFITTIMKLIQI